MIAFTRILLLPILKTVRCFAASGAPALQCRSLVLTGAALLPHYYLIDP